MLVYYIKQNIKKFILFSILTTIIIIFSSIFLYLNYNCITYELENSSATLNKSKIVNNYVAFENEEGAFVEINKVNSPSTGKTPITFVYSNNSLKSVNMEIKINNTIVKPSLEFTKNKSWVDWQKLTIVENLKLNNNRICIKTTTSEGGPFIDKIIIGGIKSSNEIKNASSKTDVKVTNFDIETFIPVDDSTPKEIIDVKTTHSPQESEVKEAPLTKKPIAVDIILGPDDVDKFQDSINNLKSGKTIYLKGGTYKFSETLLISENNSGTTSLKKSIIPYQDEQPILDFSALPFSSISRGIILEGSYWIVDGIKIQNAGDNGMLIAGHHNIINGCDFYSNKDTGLQISRNNSSYESIDQWPSNNIVSNSYSHNNFDTDDGEDADGFSAKLTCGEGNKFINCISKYNIDDGFDLYTQKDKGKIGSVYFENCEASYNGQTENGTVTKNGDGNGFKLGGNHIAVDHKIVGCIAFKNNRHGFTWNNNPGNISVINCKSYDNVKDEYDYLINK